jgi:glyoxylase-like metal-dependent hydrolase (beta-lactamase superfamily II)
MLRRFTALCLAFLVPAALAQAPAPDTAIQTEQVAPGIYMLIGKGGNIGASTGADGTFLIDDQYAPMTPSVIAALKAVNAPMPRFVLNTHWHGDHTGGNENLAKVGALLVAHDQVRKRMSSDQFISFVQMAVPASPLAALPVVTFNDTVTFYLNGDEIHGTYAPHAHTDGDVFVHFRKSNVIHAGDLFFRYYPFIDLSSGGSLAGVIAAVDRVLALADDKTRIIPGHGPLANRADLVEYRDMLSVTSGRIRDLAKAGKTVDEVLAAAPTADYDAKWGWAFITPERYTRMIYELVTSELNAGRT